MANFNLRVYGLIINNKREILLSDERRGDHSFTKFPGGGLEKNEGILQCLHREIKEELGAVIVKTSFLYFNDHFQTSAYRKEDSLVAFYYLVELHPDFQVSSTNKQPVGSTNTADYERFRWVSLDAINEESLTFPLDKKALQCLLAKTNAV